MQSKSLNKPTSKNGSLTMNKQTLDLLDAIEDISLTEESMYIEDEIV